MKMDILDQIIYKARILKHIPGIKPLLLPFYIRFARQLRNYRFRKYGMKVMSEFDSLMNSNNIHYSIFAGTLLGAIREQNPLKHDLDLDTIVFSKDYSQKIETILLNNGFKPVRHYLVDDGRLGREDTYKKYGVTIDIFYAYSDEKYETYQCDFPGCYDLDNRTSMKVKGYVDVRRIEFPISYGLKRIIFGGIKVNAIDNAEEWLSCRYGLDYMTPNPKFCDKGDNPHMFKWEDVKGQLVVCNS
jgi:phosphorylcholine metabolism protein LicD